jgi:hypothetical protein
VCNGHAGLPRGEGRRDAGFLSDDGAWAHCERVEHAGGLPLEGTTPPTYLHRIGGPCNCGEEHAPTMAAQNGHAHTPRQPAARIVATYDYTAADGAVVYQAVRLDPKDFRRRRPDGHGGWIWNLDGVQRVPYHLPELLAHVDRDVIWVEGERDADRLAAIDVLATTTIGGASSYRRAYREHFRNRRRVVVIPDNDADGRAYAAAVATSLIAVGAGVRMLELPGLAAKGDVSDWLDAGHTTDEFLALIKATPPWEPLAPPVDLAGDHLDAAAQGSPRPIATAALLDEVRTLLRRYLVLPDELFYDAVALWVLHAHATAAADTTPRLIFKSPEKESGKTRALELLELLVPAPLAVMNTTIAAIFRLLKEEQATVLFDEVDAIFSSKAGNYEDLRALLNAGYRRGATVARVVGEGKRMHTERFPVFAATALAAIGDLPDTIESRAVIVPMRRRATDEHVDQFRRRKVEQAVVAVRAQLQNWALRYTDELAEADPQMPASITDRAADLWEPLLAIADLAGEEWAQRARHAAVSVVKGRVAEDASIGVRLLADIKVVMDGKDRMASASLCTALNALEESGWGGWNDGKGIGQRDLAKRLHRYGVEPKVIKLADGTTPRGYLHAAFFDPFDRYLRQPAPTGSATSATPIRTQVAEVAEVALGGEEVDGGATSLNGSAADPALDDLRALAAVNDRGGR